MNGPDSPLPQKPIASSHAIVMNENPSYISASCTSVGFRSVRVHSCAPASRHRHRGEVVELVPRRPAVQRRADRLDAGSAACAGRATVSTCDTITAVPPSHGTSQS